LVSRENIFHGNGNRRRFLAGFPNRVAAAAETTPRRSGLFIRGGRRTRTAKGRGEPHPTLMRTLAAQPQRAERLCQGTCPGPSRYSFVPSIAAIQNTTGSLPLGSVPLGTAGVWGGSSGRILLFLAGRGLAGVGRTWDGHRPSPFSWDSVMLIPLVPRPTGGSRPLLRPPQSKSTEAAGVPSKRLDAWAVPDPSSGVDAPWLLGVVVGVSP